MSDKQTSTHPPLSHTFINHILRLNPNSANRAQNYRKKILADYIQAELEEPHPRHTRATQRHLPTD